MVMLFDQHTIIKKEKEEDKCTETSSSHSQTFDLSTSTPTVSAADATQTGTVCADMSQQFCSRMRRIRENVCRSMCISPNTESDCNIVLDPNAAYSGSSVDAGPISSDHSRTRDTRCVSPVLGDCDNHTATSDCHAADTALPDTKRACFDQCAVASLVSTELGGSRDSTCFSPSSLNIPATLGASRLSNLSDNQTIDEQRNISNDGNVLCQSSISLVKCEDTDMVNQMSYETFPNNSIANDAFSIKNFTSFSNVNNVNFNNALIETSCSTLFENKLEDSFVQSKPCFEFPNTICRCRECIFVNEIENTDAQTMFCRFTLFRRLRKLDCGTLVLAGFSHPLVHPDSDDQKLWMSSSEGSTLLSSSFETEITDSDQLEANRFALANFLLENVGPQFCEMVHEEEKVRVSYNIQSSHSCGTDKLFSDTLQTMSTANSLWKRVLPGCREMCDVCATTLFNFHYICRLCGFAVCIDCYRTRNSVSSAFINDNSQSSLDRWQLFDYDVSQDDVHHNIDGDVDNYGRHLSEQRDVFGWLHCIVSPSVDINAGANCTTSTFGLACPVNKSPIGRKCTFRIRSHIPSQLVLTQILAGNSLRSMRDRVHSARFVAGLSDCPHCESVTTTSRPCAVRTPESATPVAQRPAALTTHRPAFDARNLIDFMADTDQSAHDIPSNTERAHARQVECSEFKQALSSACGLCQQTDAVLDELSALDTDDRSTLGPLTSLTSEDFVADDITQLENVSHCQQQLKHYKRRYKSRSHHLKYRVKAPSCVRVMTLSESSLIYPSVQHMWLCQGRLLCLYPLTTPVLAAPQQNLFSECWARGQPILCIGVGSKLSHDLWSVEAFMRDFGTNIVDLVDCRTGNVLYAREMNDFWHGFGCASSRLKNADGQPMILKLKDWPPTDDFADLMPRRFADLMANLPMPSYTRRDGSRNLASYLPHCFVRPDLGPKMYVAYGCALHPDKASTNLHLDVSDAVNIMVSVVIPPDGDTHSEQVLRAIDEAGCDPITRRRVQSTLPGALWHIYHSSDADKIRDFLNKIALEQGVELEAFHDPIHDQSWYLDECLRERLYQEYTVEAFSIVQCAGDAIFIPAGAPHQVRNLHSCIKVAEDFVSPENIGHCFDMMQEFRGLSETHTNHEDKLQIKNIVYHATKEASNFLLKIVD